MGLIPSLLGMLAAVHAEEATRGSGRRVLIVTSVVGRCSTECDRVAVYPGGRAVPEAAGATDAEVSFAIPDPRMPRSACRAAAFRAVPEGPARIHVRPAVGA